MDAFDSMFSDTSKVTGSVKEKLADGSVRVGKLATGPVGGALTEKAFAEAAAEGGCTLTKSRKLGETRSLSLSRKDVTGEKAKNSILAMLGFNPVKDKVKVKEGEPAPV